MREITQKQLPYVITALLLIFTGFMIRPAYGFLFMSAITLAVIIYQLRYVWKIRKKGVRVTGYITTYENSGNDYPVPCIEFSTVENETISGQPYISSSIEVTGIRLNQEQPLQEVVVIYNPRKPSDFLLPDRLGKDIFSFLVITMVFLFLFGLCIYDLCTGSVF